MRGLILMLKGFFHPKSPSNDAILNRLEIAHNVQVVQTNRLTETVKEMLDENDRLRGQKNGTPHRH